MDAHLTDLDALVLKIRERRSREYLSEAITAYRVGAYKAAVIEVWIAVTFDILMKIREIGQAGDGAANDFVRDFETAVQNNNRERLLKLEGDLLDKALDPFAFIGRQEYQQLVRLKEDRNLCAHPAFSTEAELFQPRPELVRLHIVTAVESLLAATPVQGKTLIAVFAADVASPAYPREQEQAIKYVADRYLARIRPGALDSFAAVLLKGYLRGTVAEWAGHESSILNALGAIARFHSTIWSSDIRTIAARLINELAGDRLAWAFGLLKAFPDLRDRLDNATVIRLRALIDNFNPTVSREDAIFAAVGTPEFHDTVLVAFNRLDPDRKAAVLVRYPSRIFWAENLNLLREAGSFRGAEYLFRRMITPLATVIETNDLGELAATVQENGQVWDASDTPTLLADFIDRVSLHVRFEASPWTSLKTFLDSRSSNDRFDEVWVALAKRGVKL